MIHEHFPPKYGTHSWHEQRATLKISDRARKASKRAKEINHETGITWKGGDIQELKEKGIQLLNPVISKKKAEEMYEYFSSKRMNDFYGTHQSFTLENKPDFVKMARTDTKTNILCPYVIDLMTDVDLISKASEYLNAPATLNCVFPLWSFKEAVPCPINMQLFHRDADDYKFVKLFVLLTDTDMGNGEQVYVVESHAREDLPNDMYDIKRYSDEAVLGLFEEKNIKNIYGKAGTSWLADTHGIHRGTVPTKANRLLLQLQYTLDPTPIFNYKQFRYSKWNELSDLARYSTRMYLRS